LIFQLSKGLCVFHFFSEPRTLPKIFPRFGHSSGDVSMLGKIGQRNSVKVSSWDSSLPPFLPFFPAPGRKRPRPRHSRLYRVCSVSACTKFFTFQDQGFPRTMATPHFFPVVRSTSFNSLSRCLYFPPSFLLAACCSAIPDHDRRNGVCLILNFPFFPALVDIETVVFPPSPPAPPPPSTRPLPAIRSLCLLPGRFIGF